MSQVKQIFKSIYSTLKIKRDLKLFFLKIKEFLLKLDVTLISVRDWGMGRSPK